MDLAFISLLALFIAILISCFSSLNVGLLSIAFAFTIGVLLNGMTIQAIIAGFPTDMFLTLVGTTLLFSQAKANGTLDKVIRMIVKSAQGKANHIPILFFALALIIAAIGPGNIAATALLAPVAMAVANRAGISAFLMSIMVCNGANAGAFSPFAPTGIIANDLMARIGLTGVEWQNYFNTLLVQSFVAFGGYFSLSRFQSFVRPADPAGALGENLQEQIEPFNTNQKLTLAVIAALVGSVILVKIDVTIGAFTGVAVLSLLSAADEKTAVEAVPWNMILMVTGVRVLIALMDKVGGMNLFTSILATFSSKTTITGVIAFITGVISVYSSSSGVVLPAFLPAIPGLLEKTGGGDPLALAYSINVAAHLVDVSPLSTLGALCIANAAASENRSSLFHLMLAWGLSMSVVGGIVCFIFFGLLR